MPRLPVLVDKHQPVRAVERVSVQVVLELGRMAVGKEPMRIPAFDFGGQHRPLCLLPEAMWVVVDSELSKTRTAMGA
jgi:hypothetical protein